MCIWITREQNVGEAAKPWPPTTCSGRVAPRLQSLCLSLSLSVCLSESWIFAAAPVPSQDTLVQAHWCLLFLFSCQVKWTLVGATLLEQLYSATLLRQLRQRWQPYSVYPPSGVCPDTSWYIYIYITSSERSQLRGGGGWAKLLAALFRRCPKKKPPFPGSFYPSIARAARAKILEILCLKLEFSCRAEPGPICLDMELWAGVRGSLCTNMGQLLCWEEYTKPYLDVMNPVVDSTSGWSL